MKVIDKESITSKVVEGKIKYESCKKGRNRNRKDGTKRKYMKW